MHSNFMEQGTLTQGRSPFRSGNFYANRKIGHSSNASSAVSLQTMALKKEDGDFKFDDWPNRPFYLRDFRVNCRPRQKSDGRWWVRGVLFNNPGRVVVDVCFSDLAQPAIEMHCRDIEYLRRESAEIRLSIERSLLQLQADTQLDESSRVVACQNLLHELNEYGCYGKQDEVHALSRRLLDYLKMNYRYPSTK